MTPVPVTPRGLSEMLASSFDGIPHITYRKPIETLKHPQLARGFHVKVELPSLLPNPQSAFVLLRGFFRASSRFGCMPACGTRGKVYCKPEPTNLLRLKDKTTIYLHFEQQVHLCSISVLYRQTSPNLEHSHLGENNQ